MYIYTNSHEALTNEVRSDVISLVFGNSLFLHLD